MEVVDILKGQHYEPAYSKLNPNHLIPMLDDDGFRLTESAAILRYLADKIGSPAYPKDLKQRAKVNEVMDWFNSNFYRDWGYGLIYPQLFPHLKREDAKVQEAVVAWGKEKSKAWLQVLNDHWLGGGKQYLCGDTVTIADYFGTGLTSIGELIHSDISTYPNIARWLDAMKSRPSYAKVSEIFNGFVKSTTGQPFEVL
jgi:glutathione S-transferase